MNSHDHEELLAGLAGQLEMVFNQSEQGIYLYLDDHHKLCNQKFSNMLGYADPAEWAAVEISFPVAFVDPASQEKLVMAYQLAMEKFVASTNKIAWKKKNGDTVETSVILVPFEYDQHPVALHFVQVA